MGRSSEFEKGELVPRAWVTKYACTSGVFVVENCRRSFYNPSHLFVKRGEQQVGYVVYTGEWALTKEEAHKQIAKKLEVRRKSLESQLEKIEELEAALRLGLLPMDRREAEGMGDFEREGGL